MVGMEEKKRLRMGENCIMGLVMILMKEQNNGYFRLEE